MSSDSMKSHDKMMKSAAMGMMKMKVTSMEMMSKQCDMATMMSK